MSKEKTTNLRRNIKTEILPDIQETGNTTDSHDMHSDLYHYEQK